MFFVVVFCWLNCKLSRVLCPLIIACAHKWLLKELHQDALPPPAPPPPAVYYKLRTETKRNISTNCILGDILGGVVNWGVRGLRFKRGASRYKVNGVQHCLGVVLSPRVFAVLSLSLSSSEKESLRGTPSGGVAARVVYTHDH